MRVAKRNEDMSQRGYLQIMVQEDGDIIVVVYPEQDGLIEPGGSVEFCALGAGGGRSPHTRAALLSLIEAIDLDNRERPINLPSNVRLTGAEPVGGASELKR